MQDQVNAIAAPKRVPWNKGKLTGAKPPLLGRHDLRFGRSVSILNLAEVSLQMARTVGGAAPQRVSGPIPLRSYNPS